jgi:hypothetical protein
MSTETLPVTVRDRSALAPDVARIDWPAAYRLPAPGETIRLRGDVYEVETSPEWRLESRPAMAGHEPQSVVVGVTITARKVRR